MWRKPAPPRSRTSSSSACSPAWPNGGWPRSWPSPTASTRSSFRRSARPTPRAMPAVSSVCVSRVRKWSPSGSTKTCVLCRSRRNAFEWTMRSRSRWNGVRSRHSSSACVAPAVLVRPDGERRQPALLVLAHELRERIRHTSRELRLRHPPRLNDDRDGPTVRAPGRAGDVRRARRAQEGDHRGDLLGLGEPAERPSRADLREHLVAVALLVGEAARRRAMPASQSGRASRRCSGSRPSRRGRRRDARRTASPPSSRSSPASPSRAASRPSTRRSRSCRSRARACAAARRASRGRRS